MSADRDSGLGSSVMSVDPADERWQGPGSAAPESVESTGSAAVALRPYSFALYAGDRTR